MTTETGKQNEKQLFTKLTKWIGEIAGVDLTANSKYSHLIETAKRDQINIDKQKINNKYTKDVNDFLTFLQQGIIDLKNAVLKSMYPLKGNVLRGTAFEVEHSNAIAFINNKPENYIECLKTALLLERYDFFFMVYELEGSKRTQELENLHGEVLEKLNITLKSNEWNELQSIYNEGKQIVSIMNAGTVSFDTIPSNSLEKIATYERSVYETLTNMKYPSIKA